MSEMKSWCKKTGVMSRAAAFQPKLSDNRYITDSSVWLFPLFGTGTHTLKDWVKTREKQKERLQEGYLCLQILPEDCVLSS